MMKKVHMAFGFLLVLIIHASCSTLQHSKANVTVDKSEEFETCSDDECGTFRSCESVGNHEVCSCKAGLSGDLCDTVTDCIKDDFCGSKEIAKCEYDGTSGGKCVCNEDGTEFNSEKKKCLKTCNDVECGIFGSCEAVGNHKFCRCKPGISGNLCETVTDCIKDEFCGSKGIAECEYDGASGGKCVCREDGTEFNPEKKMCLKTCNDDECGTFGSCEAVGNHKFCSCEPGISGDLCDTVTDCIKDDFCGSKGIAECEYDGTSGGKCVCNEDGTEFNSENKKCLKTCNDDECGMFGSCEYVGNHKFCSCKPGISGDLCETVTDCIKDDFCGSKGIAECEYDGTSGGKCVCNEDGREFNPEKKKCLKTCNDVECGTFGSCESVGDQKFCSCKPGISGDLCDTVTDCIKDDFCGSKGIAECEYDGTSGGKCVCKEDGTEFNPEKKKCLKIDPCAENPCQNGGMCETVGGSAKCKCKSGFIGEFCDTEVDPCAENPCQNGGTCETVGGNAKCICEPGFTGELCDTDQCNPNLCENGGECIVVEGKMKCKCKVPYTGDRCETKCHCENGLCVMDKHGKMKCACNPKHSLTDDETCKPCDCGNKGKCIFQMKVVNKSIQYWKMCVCNKGSAEKDGKCVDCNCGPNSLCEFEGEEKHCYCEEGYTEKEGVCTGLCTDNPCKNGGTCEIRENGYKCICKKHYFGKMCEMGPCADSPCKNGGTCEVVGNDYKCTCRDPYFGKMCEMDSCTPNPCQNGGTCFVDGNMFRCACMDLVSGTTCEIDNRFLLGALLLLIILVFLIIICGGFCLFKIKQKVSQNFHP